MGLKENIRFFRTQKKLTLEEVAKVLGVRGTTIQRYESGVISNIPQDKIEKLAEVFNITPSQLIGWDINKGTEVNDPPKQKAFASLRFFNAFMEFTNQKPTDITGVAAYGEFTSYIKKFKDINIYSLESYMNYLLETLPDKGYNLYIDDIIEMYRVVSDFTEYRFSKLSEKNSAKEK